MRTLGSFLPCPHPMVQHTAPSRGWLAPQVVEILAVDRCSTFEECIAWGRRRFQDYFHDRVAQLTYTFPEDALTSTGTRQAAMAADRCGGCCAASLFFCTGGREKVDCSHILALYIIAKPYRPPALSIMREC